MAAAIVAAGASASVPATSAAPSSTPGASTPAPVSASASFAPSTAPGGVRVLISAPQVRLTGACVLYLDPVATASARSTDCTVSRDGLAGSITVPLRLAQTGHPVEAVLTRTANLAVLVGPTTVQLGDIVVPEATITPAHASVRAASTVTILGGGFNVGADTDCTLTLGRTVTRCTVDGSGRLSGTVTASTLSAGGPAVDDVVVARETVDGVRQVARTTFAVSPPPPTTPTRTATSPAATTAAATTTTSPGPSASHQTQGCPCGFWRWPPGTALYVAGGGIGGFALLAALAPGVTARHRRRTRAAPRTTHQPGTPRTSRPVTAPGSPAHHLQLHRRVLSITTRQLPGPEGTS